MKQNAKLILSNSVEQKMDSSGEATIGLINPFIAVNPKYFPTQYSFALTILITGVDLTGQEKMSIKIISPSNKDVLYTGEIETPIMEGNVTMNLEFKNVNLDEEGEFKVEFNFNNETIGKTKFEVQYLAGKNN